MKALLVLKDLQPNRPDKATYLANHKKTGLWPWTQLSACPRTILFGWKSVVDHVDQAAPGAPEQVDDGEAKEGNDTETGKTRQLFPTWRGVRLYEGLLVRLPAPENNNRRG